MLQGFGQAPVCIELDLDSFDGPWTHVERFRGRSGWLVVAEARVMTADAAWDTTLVAACDGYGEPVPPIMAPNLLACACSLPAPCDESPPDELDEFLDEAAQELRLSWLRENNAGMRNLSRTGAERIAALEAATRAAVDDVDYRIADLRRRRRMPGVTPHAIGLFEEAITANEVQREAILHRLTEQRAQVRRAVVEEELALLQRTTVSVTWEPLYHVSWSAAGRVGEDELAVRDHIRAAKRNAGRYAHNARPAQGRDGGNLDELLAARLPNAVSPPPQAKAATTPVRTAKPEEFEHLRHRAEKLVVDIVEERRVTLMVARRYRIKIAALRRDVRSLAAKVNTALASTEPLRVLLVTIEQRLDDAEAALVKREREGVDGNTGKLPASAPAPNTTEPMVLAKPRPCEQATASAPDRDGKLHVERAALARQLAELETTGTKFLRGSPKFERNREQRADLSGRIGAIDARLAGPAIKLPPVEPSLEDQRAALEAELALHHKRGAQMSDGQDRFRRYRDQRLSLLGRLAELNTRIARQSAREQRA